MARKKTKNRKPQGVKKVKPEPPKESVNETDTAASPPIRNPRPRRTQRNKAVQQRDTRPLLFGRSNFLFFGLGLLLIITGFLMMSGGSMPDSNTWNEQIIYSPMRITVAPAVVLGGLGVIIFGIFKDHGKNEDERKRLEK